MGESRNENVMCTDLRDSINDLNYKITLVSEIEAKLQCERNELINEKLRLPQLNLSTDEEILRNISHVITPERGREILKILHEIHKYEVEILELKYELDQNAIENEIKEIHEAFYLATSPPDAVDDARHTNVYKWHLQLKKFSPSDLEGVTIHNLNFNSKKSHPNLLHEQLGFTVDCNGTTIHVTVKSTSKSGVAGPNGDTIWEVIDCSIGSDVANQELESHGQYLFKFGRPITLFLQEIRTLVSASVVTYI